MRAAPATDPRGFHHLVELARNFAEGYQRFLAIDDEAREYAAALINHSAAPETDEAERDADYSTLALLLFPEAWNDPGMASLETPAPEGVEAGRAMAEEEETFAARVEALMDERGLTQTTLAELTGVTQAAISLMLKRQTRPQRRTIEKFAAALGVSAAELWPTVGPGDPPLHDSAALQSTPRGEPAS
jgi:lambda repressor-like predicted transcriptional regulator